MKLHLRCLMVVTALLVTGIILAGCSAKPASPAQVVKDVTVQEASSLIRQNQANPDLIIIDVRTPGEFAEGHLQNAVNIDIYAANFQAEIGRLERNKKYLVYCRSGARSRNAADMMQKLGFKEVYNVTAGISQWVEAGLPTVK